MAVSPILGQQDMPTTQYLFNKLSLNPAYAGASGDIEAVGLYRNQWNGIQGQPIQYVGNFSMPVFGTNSNIGFNLNLDKIGPISLFNFFGNYAYKLPLTENKSLRLGIRGGYTHGVVNQAALEGYQANDPNFTSSDVFFNKPVVGLGAYYQSDRLALSLSIPNMVMSDIDFTSDKNIFRNVFQTFIGAEYLFPLSENFALKPAAFLRYNANSPMNVDMNIYGIINKFLWLGGGRRSSDNYMVNAVFIFNNVLFPKMKNEMRLGYAFDFSNTTYNYVTSGSHELMIGINLNKGKNDKVQSVSPRYF